HARVRNDVFCTRRLDPFSRRRSIAFEIFREVSRILQLRFVRIEERRALFDALEACDEPGLEQVLVASQLVVGELLRSEIAELLVDRGLELVEVRTGTSEDADDEPRSERARVLLRFDALRELLIV